MPFSIVSIKKELLDEVDAYIESHIEVRIKEPKSGYTQYYTMLSEEKEVEFLRELLEKYQEISINARYTTDDEDRGPSWSSTTRYKSMMRDGKNVLECTGSTSDWY